MPYLSRIAIYPVKGLDPVYVESAGVTPYGAIEDDRRWVIVKKDGSFLNGKREPKIHQLRLVDYRSGFIHLKSASGDFEGNLHSDLKQATDFLADFFGYDVDLLENETTGFPDDLVRGGPTVVSKGSIETVSNWFGGLPYDETWRRFRANLEIDDAPPFWEDRLLDEDDEAGVPFKIGDVSFLGMNPCARCIVPTRDPDTGESIAGFAKTFRSERERTLPEWAARERFDHYFRLALNTILNADVHNDGDELTLRVGDHVTLPD